MLVIVRDDLSPDLSQIRMIADPYFQVTLTSLTPRQADRLYAALGDSPEMALKVEPLSRDGTVSTTWMRGTTTNTQYEPSPCPIEDQGSRRDP